MLKMLHNALLRLWAKMHKNTLSVTFLIVAKEKLDTNIEMPKKKKFAPNWLVP